MTRTIGIITARMASSRLPGKPLALICGIPMVGHVYFRSKMSQALDEVYIATCDNEIYHAMLHQVSTNIVSYHSVRHPVLSQLPRGQARALIAWPGLVSPNVHRYA